MVRHIEEDQIQLMISRANIRSIKILKGGDISVEVGLMVGDKELTNLYLSNDTWTNEDNPRRLHLSDKDKRELGNMQKKMFELIKKSSALSLERIQVALPGIVQEEI